MDRGHLKAEVMGPPRDVLGKLQYGFPQSRQLLRCDSQILT